MRRRQKFSSISGRVNKKNFYKIFFMFSKNLLKNVNVIFLPTTKLYQKLTHKRDALFLEKVDSP